ncbi:unnamed protein product, partial [Schistosoma turkestanicum]
LSAPSSLSMPEVFTSTNGDLTRKTFVSLGSLDLEKFDIVGIVHNTNSNLDLNNNENDNNLVEKNSFHENNNNSYPNIFIVDKIPNILSGKTIYFHNTMNNIPTITDNNRITTTTPTPTTTTTTTTATATTTSSSSTNSIYNVAHNSYSDVICCNTVSNQKNPHTTMSYLLPRVSIQEIKETTNSSNTLITSSSSSSNIFTVRRTR